MQINGGQKSGCYWYSLQVIFVEVVSLLLCSQKRPILSLIIKLWYNKGCTVRFKVFLTLEKYWN